ncbi:hypothetical protein nbrc107696_16320 [Gordonia spumicola]|uniref:Lipoprotein n=1 Tax=Gordonia spumicola TaxID=589161 RepID=A0A7I9V710_9ACTN|nr:hypothetical protein [Gordonia spumicola]GEE01186.1 hypothetical protein nbrc107696_16320 [Gordonia spumicola]
MNNGSTGFIAKPLAAFLLLVAIAVISCIACGDSTEQPTSSAPVSTELVTTTRTVTATPETPTSHRTDPADWESMSCSDYTALSPVEQREIYRSLAPDETDDRLSNAAILLHGICSSLPTVALRDALAGNLPG